MPAKSKTQQRLFGMAYAYKEDKLNTDDVPEKLLDKVKDLASNMSKKDLKKYAKTDHSGLPEKKKDESVDKVRAFKQFILKEAQKIKDKNKMIELNKENVRQIIKEEATKLLDK